MKTSKKPKALKACKLNLEDALKLASILEQYADTSVAETLAFIEIIINKIQPTEYLECVRLLTKTDVDTIEKQISLNVLTAFIEGLKFNKIISLIEFHRSLKQ